MSRRLSRGLEEGSGGVTGRRAAGQGPGPGHAAVHHAPATAEARGWEGTTGAGSQAMRRHRARGRLRARWSQGGLDGT